MNNIEQKHPVPTEIHSFGYLVSFCFETRTLYANAKLCRWMGFLLSYYQSNVLMESHGL